MDETTDTFPELFDAFFSLSLHLKLNRKLDEFLPVLFGDIYFISTWFELDCFMLTMVGDICSKCPTK